MAKSAIKPEFKSVLDTPSSEIERPPTLPRGYYHCVVQGPPRIDKSSQKQTEFSEFALKVLSVWEKDGIPQVDEDELEEFGEVKDQIIRVTFYHTEKSIFRLKEFLTHCGIDTDGKETLRQLIQEAQGCQVIAHVVHEPWQSGEGVSARVRGTAPVEE